MKNNNKKYKYLVFDFDGTLADTHLGIVKAYQESFRQMGKKVPSEELVTSTIGLVMKDAMQVLDPTFTEEENSRIMKIYYDTFPVVGFPVTKAFPGVVETLEELYSNGYRMAIATSRGHQTLDYMAEMIGIRKYFDVLYAADDVVNHKPAPDLVNLVLEKFDLTPDEVLVIGDATYDIQMGHAAGCDACGIAWGNMSKEMLSTVAPEYLLDSIPELKGILL